MPRASTLLLLFVASCALDSGALAPPGNESDGGPEDSGRDARDTQPIDVGLDAPAPDAPPIDADPADANPDDTNLPPADGGCVATDETCDGEDDDCDGTIDEETCADCERRERAGNTYLFCALNRDWMAARADCESRGYRLVSLDDAGEDRWVWGEASRIVDTDWWFGLHDLNTEGTYEWTDGRVVYTAGAATAYVNWRDGGPQETEDQDCIELDRTSSDGLWADSFCTITQGYVCEVP